jgi:CelD/BcsL family acetyltransferase involved in cellulose biosynthesis
MVARHPSATVYHHPAWLRVMQSTYGYMPTAVALARDGELTGGIPFMCVRSRLTGNRLVALPFTTYCQPLLGAGQLEDAIRRIRLLFPGVRLAEIRFLPNGSGDHPSARRTPYVTHFLDMDREPEAMLARFHSTSVRQRIRRASKEGLSFRWSGDPRDLRAFYNLLQGVRRRQGLPIKPFPFYANMRRHLEPAGIFRLGLVEHKDRIVAAGIVLLYRQTMHIEYTASDPRMLAKSPNQFLIWEMLKQAWADGARRLDFGRTDIEHASLLEFKDRWATRRVPILAYSMPAAPARSMGSPGGRRILREINKRLPPFILRLEGRVLYRHMA